VAVGEIQSVSELVAIRGDRRKVKPDPGVLSVTKKASLMLFSSSSTGQQLDGRCRAMSEYFAKKGTNFDAVSDGGQGRVRAPMKLFME